jgi:hypothetical protein
MAEIKNRTLSELGFLFGSDEAPRSVDLSHVGSTYDVGRAISQSLPRRLFRILNTHTGANTQTTSFDIDTGTNVTEVIPQIGLPQYAQPPQHMITSIRAICSGAAPFTTGSLLITTLLSGGLQPNIAFWDDTDAAGQCLLAGSPTATERLPILIMQTMHTSGFVFQTTSSNPCTVNLLLEVVTGRRGHFDAW